MRSFKFSGAFALALLATQSSTPSFAMDIDGSAAAHKSGSDFSKAFGMGATQDENFEDACIVKVIQYFSDTNLNRINTELGALKNWSNDNFFYDEENIADYIVAAHEEHEDDGTLDALHESFKNISNYHAVFDAGTDMGKVYLTDPQLAVGAMFAYVDYAEQMKTMMHNMGQDDQLKEFSTKFSKSLRWIRGVAERAETSMLRQYEQNCYAPEAF